jgi:hypothetical protein
LVALAVVGLAGAGLVAQRSAPAAPASPPAGPNGTRWFGDTSEAEFRQGTTDGVDTYGRNDYLVPRDGFNGTRIDASRWRVHADERAKVEHVKQNGSVRFSVTQAGITENTSYIELFSPLVDEAQASARNFEPTIQPVSSGGYYWVMFASRRSYGGPLIGQDAWAVIRSGDSIRGADNGTLTQDHLPIDANTTLMINRTGSSLRAFFLNGTEWIELFRNDSGPQGPLYVSIGITQRADPWTGPVSVEFDDFKVAGEILGSFDVDQRTGVSLSDSIRMLPLSDNFDDGVLNSDRWDPPQESGGMKIVEANGSLEFTRTNGAGTAAAEIWLRKALRADLSVELRFRVPDDCASGDWRFAFNASIGTGKYGVERSCTGGSVHEFKAFNNGTLIGSSLAAGSTGLLRISSTASSLTLSALDAQDLGTAGLFEGHRQRYTLLVSTGILGILAAMSISFARLSGTERSSVDDLVAQIEAGMQPAAYGDATLESRVVDTQENQPGQPDWQNLWFNASGTNYFVDPSTRGLWYFDEASGTALDADPLPNHGALVNGAGRAPGARGNGLVLDGANDYVSIASPGGLISTLPAGTVEAWVNTTNTAVDDQHIYSEMRSPTNSVIFLLRLKSGGAVEFGIMDLDGGCSGTWSFLITPPGVIQTNRWHHVVATHDIGYMRIFVDGVPRGEIPVTKRFCGSVSSANIGTINDGALGFFFSGRIDEVRVLDRALNQSEVRLDFESRAYIRFQLASSDSPSGPWTFRGPDGTGGTWYSLSGQATPSLLDGDRYYRYRAEINSSDPLYSPALHDVGVTASGPSIAELQPSVFVAASLATLALALSSARRKRKKDS